MNIQHSSSSNEWYTPDYIIQMIKEVLGEIDLDPASCPEANLTVKANQIFTKEDDALKHEWKGNLFLNPPGGKIGNKSLSIEFWRYLMVELERGNVDHAIYLAFSIEQLQSSQGKGVPSIGEFTFCVPSKRLRFKKPIGELDNQAPSHSNMIVYVPGKVDNTMKFAAVFSKIGVIIN
jgi:ParB family chromosome partitioning protein